MGTSISKYKKNNANIIPYIGPFLNSILKSKDFFAKNTPRVKCNNIITEAIAPAIPKPLEPYANKQTDIPILPLLGSINGGNSNMISLLVRNKVITPTTEKHNIKITLYEKNSIKVSNFTPVAVKE